MIPNNVMMVILLMGMVALQHVLQRPLVIVVMEIKILMKNVTMAIWQIMMDVIHHAKKKNVLKILVCDQVSLVDGWG